jgi:hypothetical protein
LKSKLQKLILSLDRLDHVDMDKMDDAQLADILWLSMQIEEVKIAKQKKSSKEFWEWLKKWWDNLSFKNNKKSPNPPPKDDEGEIDVELEEERLPLIPKGLKDSSGLSVKIPQKKDFYVNNELLKALDTFNKVFESTELSEELDESLTVEAFAQTDLLIPKFLPKEEKHYDLYLLIDTSESMEIWQDSIELFVKKLRIFSIFREFKLLYLDSSQKEAKIYANRAKTTLVSSLNNLENRSILFVVTDCIAPAWSKGDMLSTLYTFHKKMPTSIINMLPRRMWKSTVLGNTNITRLKQEAKCISSDVDDLILSFDENYFAQKVLKVPVVNFLVNDFKAMSNFMTQKPNSSCSGIVASEEEFEDVSQEEQEELTAKERVQDFYNHSSSTAHKLAFYLSTCTHLNFPIMKMIQHNMLPKSTQLDFAEFFVGGLLDKSNKGEFYTFHTGVRELLQEEISPYLSAEILERNSKFIAQNLGSSLEFSALLVEKIESDDGWTDQDKIFAEMSFLTLERLGGNYKKRVEKIRRSRVKKRKKEYELPKEVAHKVILDNLEGSDTYQMGSNDGHDDEKPIHQITFDHNFEIAKTPVTFEEYDLYCEDVNIEKSDDRGWGRGKRPVINVSWEDAQAYCKWLSKKTDKEYRLPTEAEWEYACRAGTTTKWSFGDDESKLEEYAWYDKNSNSKTHEVATKKENPWGLFDMHGNVWEWCEDDGVDNYNDIPRDGTAYKKNKDSNKVLRGGSWVNNASFTRSAYRVRWNPDIRSSIRGFRLLRTLP